MTLKFSRAGALRPSAEAFVDEHFAALIATEIGPLGALHMLKRMQAKAGSGPLLDDVADAATVLARSDEQDERLVGLDRQRRQMKAKVRDAKTVAEIKEILASL